MVKLILHNTFYELAYPNGIEITHKHEAGKYDFDNLPIDFKDEVERENIVITKGDITKVYMISGKCWLIMDTKDFKYLESLGVGVLRIYNEYPNKFEVKYKKNNFTYNLSHELYGASRSNVLLHLNGNKYDYRRSNCRVVPRWLHRLYTFYMAKDQHLGSIYTEFYNGKKSKVIKYTINGKTFKQKVTSNIRNTRLRIYRDIIRPILIEYNIIEGDKHVQ